MSVAYMLILIFFMMQFVVCHLDMKISEVSARRQMLIWV